MSKLICETCGQYEHQGECDMPKQAQVSAPEVEYGKLQERIKELEALIPTKEEAKHILETQRDLCELGKTENDDGYCYICRLIEAKLKAIIDKRGCNED